MIQSPRTPVALLVEDARHLAARLLKVNPASKRAYLTALEAVAVVQERLSEGKGLASYKGSTAQKDMAIGVNAALDPSYTSRRSSAQYRAGKDLETFQRRLFGKFTALTQKYLNERIGYRDFIEGMADLLKGAYRDAYKLGVKASGQTKALNLSNLTLTSEDRTWVKSASAHELRYFNKLLRRIARGGMGLPQINRRLRAYVDAVAAAFTAARTLHQTPFSLIYWVLEDDDACPDCKWLHMRNPWTRKTLPCTPKSGQTRCLSNCRCALRTVQATLGEVAEVERAKPSRDALARALARHKRAGRLWPK